MEGGPSPHVPLRFEVLGAVRAFSTDRELDLGPAKQRAVLAVLLLNPGRPVRPERIVDAVWGDVPPENGANVVQKYIAGLRRVLEPDRSPRTPGELLALTEAGYRLSVAPGALDAEQFRSGLARAAGARSEGQLAAASELLREALTLWRGPALAGQTGPVFDAARLRLAAEQGTGWESWAELELQLGRHGTLVPELVRLVAEFPLREDLRALLMTALYRGGRQAEALAVYREARDFLRSEYGVEPGARLQETQHKILRGDVTPAPAAAPPAAVPAQWQPPTGITAWGPPMPEPATSAWRAAPPPELPRNRRFTAVEVIFALLVPVLTFSLLNVGYFLYAAIRRRDRSLLIPGAAYTLVAWVFFSIAVATAPSGDSTLETTPTEDVFFPLFFLIGIAAMVHGAIVAASGHSSLHCDQARNYAHLHPDRARHLGVGRPDLVRPFDDGGLVDLNHAPGHELSRLRGFGPAIAHRIVVERTQRGAFEEPDELVTRGVVTAATLHRVARRLICLPPVRPAPAPVQAPAPGWLPQPYQSAADSMPHPSYPAPADPWSGTAG